MRLLLLALALTTTEASAQVGGQPMALYGGRVTTGKLADGSVTTPKMGDDAVTNAKIINGAVTTGKLDTDAVTEAKILNAAVTTAKMGDGAISTSKLLRGIDATLGSLTTLGNTTLGDANSDQIPVKGVVTVEGSSLTFRLTSNSHGIFMDDTDNASVLDLARVAAGVGYLDVYSGGAVAHRLQGNADSYVNPSAGEFGVGITAPTSKLHVSGDTNFAGVVTVNSSSITVNTGTNSTGIALRDTADGSLLVDTARVASGIGYTDWLSGGARTIRMQANADSYINTGAEFGIGLTAPVYPLHTVGGIFASGASGQVIAHSSMTVATTAGVAKWSVDNSGNEVAVGTFTAAQVMARPPAAQTISAGNTVTADACGGVKMVTNAGAVATDTTNTFTAPAGSNTGCCMDIILDNAAVGNLTLDANASFNTLSGADVIMTVCDVVRVCSNGTDWYQANALQANTCN